MDSSREQFSLIYDQYIEKIYRFVYLRVSSQEIAEDITSKVFLKGWESYQKQDFKVQNMGSFLYKIASNSIIDFYRDKGKAKVISADKVPQIIEDHRTNSLDKAVLSADLDIIKSALSKIKKDYQDVVIWHYLEDMPAEEIALITGKTPGAVRVMIHRGLSALKKQLNVEEV